MRKSTFALAILLFSSSLSQAGNISLMLNNKSGEALSSLVAVPKGVNGFTAQNALAGPIANGSFGTASIPGPTDACVYALTFTFASGKAATRPDMDLCHVSDLVVE
jgi:hypothetical protein